MGLSTLKGNSGYIGRNFRSTSGTTAIGTMSVQKHYLERQSERLGVPEPPAPPVTGTNIIFSDNFETGDLSKWTVRTPSENTWVVTDGTGISGIPYSGTSSAFVSADGGTSWTYGSTGGGNPGPTQDWSPHMFFDISGATDSPPWGVSPITGFTLTFAWNCNASQAGVDFGYIMCAPIEVVAGFPVDGIQYTGARVGAVSNSGEFDSNYVSYVNATTWHNETAYINVNTSPYWEDITGSTTTRSNGRIVFSWSNDRNTEAQPPMAIDNIMLTWHPCPDGYDCYQEGL